MKANLNKRSKSLLQIAGLRRTGQRVAILSCMAGSERPMTAEEISCNIKDVANKVTIYRTLDRFTEAGIVHKAFLHQRTWHFELSDNCTERQCHPHFRCRDCGQTSCFPQVLLPMAKSPYRGFVIDRQMVQLEGLCAECNAMV